jgi:predicted amidohydrolase
MTRREFVRKAASGAVAASAAMSTAAGSRQAEPARPSAGKIAILGLPFTSAEGQVRANVDGAVQVIRNEMAKSRADLVVLPELFTCGYAGPDLSPYAESTDGPSARKFAELSNELDVLIGFGFAESTGRNKVYNSWMLLEPGSKKHVYRKTHLHPTEPGGKTNEPELFLPGKSLEIFPTRLGSIGVMICYDGCFVEVPRVLALKGADLILWPSRSGGYLAGQSLPHVRSLDNVIATVLVEGGQNGPNLTMDCFSAVYSENGSRMVSQKNDNSPFRVTVDVPAGRKLRASDNAGAHSLYRPRRPELYDAIGKKFRYTA